LIPGGCSGFLHSPIHLGYAVEFDQPLVAAEALALTAIHDCAFGKTLAVIENNAERVRDSKSLIELQQEIYANPKLRGAMKYEHGVFQVRDGLLANAPDEFLRIVSAWKVQPHGIVKKTAQVLNCTGTSHMSIILRIS
jgi:hypothetical protein